MNIFDLWLQCETKLLDFTDFLNSLHPTIKFTSEFSETSLNGLDFTLRLVDGFIQTDIHFKATDNHIYLDTASAHPKHVAKAIPKALNSCLEIILTIIIIVIIIIITIITFIIVAKTTILKLYTKTTQQIGRNESQQKAG